MLHKISVRSRHPSHRILRTNLPKLPVRSLIRLGSTTELASGRIEINPIESIKISANKRLMKQAFDKAEVPTAPWTIADFTNDVFEAIEEEELRWPIVAKHIYGSRGTGNTLLKDGDDFLSWSRNKDLKNYIFENYMSYMLEYRLHVTKDGCFYACRKALLRTTKPSEKWHRHLENSVWLLESNPAFNKPDSWNEIVSACVKALEQIGADILSFDVRVQSRLDKEGNEREYQRFILIECNSASSFNSTSKEISICASKYLEIIPNLIMEKAGVKR